MRYLTPLSNCRTDTHTGKVEIVYRQSGGRLRRGSETSIEGATLHTRARKRAREGQRAREREREKGGEGKVIGEKGKRNYGKGVRRTRATTTMTTTVRPGTINFHALHPPVNSSRWRRFVLERSPMKLIKINTWQSERVREREVETERGRE